VNKGGKLKVGGDVLVGLKRWETLVPKTPEVDKLLENMSGELEAAMGQGAKLITPDQLPADWTSAQVHTALGYQQKGLDFVNNQPKGTDLTPLLTAPQILHRQPLTHPAGTKFDVIGPAGMEELQFDGFGKAPNGDITLSFLHHGASVQVQTADPNAASGSKKDSGPAKADPGNPGDVACEVPGEVLAYAKLLLKNQLLILCSKKSLQVTMLLEKTIKFGLQEHT
jgi:hypothetical protein